MKKVWYENENEIVCSIEEISKSLENPGEHFLEIVKLMPGLVGVELVEQGVGFVIIKTNEGIMKRTNIKKQLNSTQIVIEFDELYQARKMITTKSHFLHEFKVSDIGVKHHIIISNMEAPGFLGFFYRNLGKSSIGKAFLNAYRTYFRQ